MVQGAFSAASRPVSRMMTASQAKRSFCPVDRFNRPYSPHADPVVIASAGAMIGVEGRGLRASLTVSPPHHGDNAIRQEGERRGSAWLGAQRRVGPPAGAGGGVVSPASLHATLVDEPERRHDRVQQRCDCRPLLRAHASHHGAGVVAVKEQAVGRTVRTVLRLHPLPTYAVQSHPP